jgi:hypothetical protein
VADGDDPRDLATRDAFFHHLGAVNFTGTAPPILAAQMLRLALRHPSTLAIAGSWLARTVRRVGVRRLLRYPRVRPVSFVMHRFMDAGDVQQAWELMQSGKTSDDAQIRETQERLSACHYAMAHPENGTLVPACVQHSVLDPAENAALRKLLPIAEVRSGANPSSPATEGKTSCE